MKLRFLALFLLISCPQAISTSDFAINLTSEGRGLSQSNGQAQEHLVIGKLYGRIKDTIRLNDKVEGSKNEHKHELSNTSRKAQGGGRAAGGANVNQRPHRSKNSTPSLLSGPHFWGSTLIPYVSVALIFLLPFY